MLPSNQIPQHSHGHVRSPGRIEGQHSIRINDQWRVCFLWRNGDAYDVEITDYH
ncbi:MAG: type II toxin-antitoxin system RelE/ParE family toxin [Acidobacteriia bacterium]|nr:type II toxin-antitoxin system RelE/ParE family toxin [Terriglobia bacterium]